MHGSWLYGMAERLVAWHANPAPESLLPTLAFCPLFLFSEVSHHYCQRILAARDLCLCPSQTLVEGTF